MAYLVEGTRTILYLGKNKMVVPLSCGGSSLWVGLDGWLVKIFWLGKLVSVFWWVKLDFFFLECNEVSSDKF